MRTRIPPPVSSGPPSRTSTFTSPSAAPLSSSSRSNLRAPRKSIRGGGSTPVTAVCRYGGTGQSRFQKALSGNDRCVQRSSWRGDVLPVIRSQIRLRYRVPLLAGSGQSPPKGIVRRILNYLFRTLVGFTRSVAIHDSCLTRRKHMHAFWKETLPDDCPPYLYHVRASYLMRCAPFLTFPLWLSSSPLWLRPPPSPAWPSSSALLSLLRPPRRPPTRTRSDSGPRMPPLSRLWHPWHPH